MDAIKKDLVVIGGGPAGLAAAIEAKRNGVDDILVLERDRELGGILQQCIHNGFGLHIFKEELTGPEYAQRFINELKDLGIEYRLDTMVLELGSDRTLSCISPSHGFESYAAKAVVLAMGCRERTRGALNIPGSRPAGIFTAGAAQRFVNMEGFLPGREVVILGSGDIGLIMARRLTLEGARVKLVCEIMPYSSGLARNIAQCLDDFGIPLRFSHTVTAIKGANRLEGVTVAAVDGNRKPIPGTEEFIECDTLLLSVGLIPENELSRAAGIAINPATNGPMVSESMETSIDGIFACGNVVHVHDLVDYVTQESRLAGRRAAAFIKGQLSRNCACVKVSPGYGVRYVVPNTISLENLTEECRFFLRVSDVFENMSLSVFADGKKIYSVKKRRFSPGEMESIAITPALRNAICGAGAVEIMLEKN